MSLDLRVILNPTSGRGQGARLKKGLEDRLSELLGSKTFEIVETIEPGHAERLAQQAAENRVPVVAVAGGDGTLHEALNGIIATDTTLAILPVGTGNDFARTIGIGTDLNLALSTLASGVATAVDVGSYQGRAFLNVAGAGYDAVVAERINQGYKRLRGKTAYMTAAITTLFRYKPSLIQLTVDGKLVREGKAFLCAVCNARSYGAGLQIAPDAKIDDGVFDVVFIDEMNKFVALSLLAKVGKGGHIRSPRVHVFRGSDVKIEADPALPVLVDGELVDPTPAEFKILPGAVQFLVPPSEKPS